MNQMKRYLSWSAYADHLCLIFSPDQTRDVTDAVNEVCILEWILPKNQNTL